MNDIVTRATQIDIEIRGGDGRTVSGICCPFDSPTEIREGQHTFTEVVKRGAWSRTIAERGPNRIKFLAQHDHRALPLGRAVLLREDASGLYGEFRVSKTEKGDEILELIRDGALDALSVGFEVIRDRWSNRMSHREIHEGKLREVSAVTFGAYSDAVILGVRNQTRNVLSLEAAKLRLKTMNW